MLKQHKHININNKYKSTYLYNKYRNGRTQGTTRECR